MKKTYYGFNLDCVEAILTFKTKEEAEKARKDEIENSDLPMGDDQISEVFEVQMTEEEFNNRVEI